MGTVSTNSVPILSKLERSWALNTRQIQCCILELQHAYKTNHEETSKQSGVHDMDECMAG